MWCKQCGQDVPGNASAEGGGFSCPRCGQALDWAASICTAGSVDESTAEADCPNAPPGASIPSPPLLYDGWESDEQLRHVQRVLGVDGTRRMHNKTGSQREFTRLDPAHAGPSPWHSAGLRNRDSRRANGGSSAGRGWPVLNWTMLSLGIMAIVCGGVLLGWSVFSQREDLWTIGLPVALAGQVALLLGLVLQLDRLWHDSRRATAKLDRFDEQLHDLKTATTMLGTSHASPGGAFYSHFAGGASPQLLLADLKSQLDLLAVRINDE